MNSPDTLYAGFAEKDITPDIGCELTGWANRAAGHNKALYILDPLLAKAMCLKIGNDAFAIVAVDLGGIDSAAIAEIRKNVAENSDLDENAILVCATHCHSAPPIRLVSIACSSDDFKKKTVAADGTGKSNSVEKEKKAISSDIIGTLDSIDMDYRQKVISTAVATVLEAWEIKVPVTLHYGENPVSGVASSRRVILKDGSFADPRFNPANEEEVSFRSKIDPMVRCLYVKSLENGQVLGVMVNFNSHPWIFSSPGVSSELPGVVARSVGQELASGQDKPILVWTAGTLGDSTIIWNLDIENLWKIHENENLEESLERRKKVFDSELERLGKKMTDGILTGLQQASSINPDNVAIKRKIVKLPLREGYSHPKEVFLAEWQKNHDIHSHTTEIQLLRIGEINLLGLPGEPFSSIGYQLRASFPDEKIVIIGLANDSGGIQYIADKKAYEQGGYELMISTLKAGSGEILVEETADLLKSS